MTRAASERATISADVAGWPAVSHNVVLSGAGAACSTGADTSGLAAPAGVVINAAEAEVKLPTRTALSNVVRPLRGPLVLRASFTPISLELNRLVITCSLPSLVRRVREAARVALGAHSRPARGPL